MTRNDGATDLGQLSAQARGPHKDTFLMTQSFQNFGAREVVAQDSACREVPPAWATGLQSLCAAIFTVDVPLLEI